MAPEPVERQRRSSQLLEELAAAFRPPAAAVAPGRRSAAPPRRRAQPRQARNVRARLLAIGALAVGVAAVLVLLSVLRDDRASAPPAEPRSKSTPTREPTPTETAAAPQALSAADTVRAFYRRAAAGDYAAAWRLAGPGMRSAFGDSFERFRSELSSLRRIEFERVAVIERDELSATVEIQTVATHADRVDRCAGSLRTVRGDGGRWRVEPAGIQCTSG